MTSLLHHYYNISGEKVWLDEEVERVLQRKKNIELLEKVTGKINNFTLLLHCHISVCNDI